MPPWTDKQIEKLKRRYVGSDEDFPALLDYVKIIWTDIQLEQLESNDQLITWDHYFRREKLLSFSNDR